jgi:hypothetical protein
MIRATLLFTALVTALAAAPAAASSLRVQETRAGNMIIVTTTGTIDGQRVSLRETRTTTGSFTNSTIRGTVGSERVDLRTTRTNSTITTNVRSTGTIGKDRVTLCGTEWNRPGATSTLRGQIGRESITVRTDSPSAGFQSSRTVTTVSGPPAVASFNTQTRVTSSFGSTTYYRQQTTASPRATATQMRAAAVPNIVVEKPSPAVPSTDYWRRRQVETTTPTPRANR